MPYGVIASFKNKLNSSACRDLGEIYGITDKMKNLISNIEYMETLLLVADDHQEEHEIQVLIRKLKDAVQAADDFFDEIATLRLKSQFGLTWKVCHIFCCTIRIVFQWGINHKLKKIEKNFCDLRNHLGWSKLMLRSSKIDRKLTTSNSELEILGRDEDRRAISKMLVEPEESHENEKVSLIGIVGVGGIGKTAVAQLVYNSEEVDEFFDVKIWVYVSENFVVANIIKQILSSLHLKNNGKESFIDTLERDLKDRKYLLVLDDVRVENSEKWAQLMTQLKCGALGSKILVLLVEKL